MQQYTALMIDLKGSRAYAKTDRAQLQQYLLEACGELNELLAPSLTRRVEFSAGDELQGLFLCPAGAYGYLRLLRLLLWPVEIRAGLGIGSWDVRLTEGGSTAQDGQAYHRARAAITAASQAGAEALYCAGEAEDELINFAIGTEALLTRRYSPHQNDLLLLTELLFPITAAGCMELQRLSQLALLMDRRGRLEYYRRRDKQPLFAQLANPPSICRVIPAGTRGRAANPVESRTRGIPTAVAQCCGIARQSVEKTMKAANMFAVRNAALMALKLMREPDETDSLEK